MTAPLPVAEPTAPLPPLASPPGVLAWNIAALVTALVAVAGSLWLSLGMGLQACPLCYYQRAVVMATAGVLLLALLTEARNSAAVSVLAVAPAVAGFGIAVWHVFVLEMVRQFECPQGLLGLGTAPQQSLAVQAVLVLLLAIAGLRRPALVVGVLLGGLFAYAAVISVAPLPAPPAEAYEQPAIVCRPPLKGPPK